MLYDFLKICVSVFLNVLNKLIGNRVPPFGGVSVVVEQEGRFLVVELPRKRVVFPGGLMTWKEMPEQTAAREGREETGLLLRPTGLIEVYVTPSDGLTHLSSINFAYAAEVVGGELRKNIEGHPRWLSEEELRQRMRPDFLRLLDAYLRWKQK